MGSFVANRSLEHDPEPDAGFDAPTAYRAPVDPKRIVRKGYDRIGAAYRPWADASNTETRAWFLSEALARIPAGTDVLELGCGPGADAVAFAEGRRYTGVDISSAMIDLARRHVPTGTFIEHDLTTLELPAARFDAVVSLFVLGHLPAAEHLPTIHRVFGWLRPGGVFCASFPTSAGDDIEEDWLGEEMFFGGIGVEATEVGLRDSGFEIELAKTREDINADAEEESFFWVIARKPA